MDHSAILKEGSWRMFLKTIGICLAGCLLAFGSNAWATPIKDIIATVGDPGGDPVAIGETKLIPVLISQRPAWKSASIRLEAETTFLQEGIDPASVQSETVEIDISLRAPFTVYVPVKVTGEGLFTMKGTIRIQMADGKKNLSGKTSWDYSISGGSRNIFSFDGEVFFGGADGFMKMVDRNLLRENSPVSKLLQKQQLMQKGVLEKSALSEAEEKELKEARDKEFKRIGTLYFDRYPIKPKPKTKALSQPLAQQA